MDKVLKDIRDIKHALLGDEFNSQGLIVMVRAHEVRIAKTELTLQNSAMFGKGVLLTVGIVGPLIGTLATLLFNYAMK